MTARDDESSTAYAIRVVKEQGAREVLAEVTRVLADAYRGYDSPGCGPAEATALGVIRDVAGALGVDLDAALAQEGS